MAERLNNHSERVRNSTTDLVRQYFKGTDISEVINDYPIEYRNDLIGFVNTRWCYEPVFATMQAKWNESVNDYINAKSEWCANHTAE